jgi:hypothetical protein
LEGRLVPTLYWWPQNGATQVWGTALNDWSTSNTTFTQASASPSASDDVDLRSRRWTAR